MAEEETTQAQPESEVPQEPDEADPRLISWLIEADQRLTSREEKAQEPGEGEEPES